MCSKADMVGSGYIHTKVAIIEIAMRGYCFCKSGASRVGFNQAQGGGVSASRTGVDVGCKYYVAI